MMKIEWRLRAVTRYLLTRYEVDARPFPQAGQDLIRGSSVMPCGEFENLNLGMKIGEAMAERDRTEMDFAGISQQQVQVTFDATHLPYPKVRAKMVCTSKLSFRDNAGWPQDREGGNVQLTAVWAEGAPDGGNAAIENRIFSKATPCANVSLQIENGEAFARFETGREFYVDFIPCPRDDEALLIPSD